METIIACSSGSDRNVAITLLRVSGFERLSSFNELFSIDLNEVLPRKAYFTKLFSNEGDLLDEVVLTYFESPNSFNGENILEISAHGNKINIDKITKTFVNSGLARVAENGEFTLRALKNKKLNLSQVEGLGQLLNSASDYDLREGLSLLSGSLSRDYENLYSHLKELKITFELMMDFSEDVGLEALKTRINVLKEKFNNAFKSLLSRAKLGKKRFLSLDLCIYGQPNAGKSTLFNSILSEGRAIVSSQAGTTRDYISESINYNSNEFRLIDTAGVRETENEIEKMGIEKSNDLLKNSFFKILVTQRKDFHPEELLIKDFDLIVVTHSGSKSIPEINNFSNVPILFLEKDKEFYRINSFSAPEEQRVFQDRHPEICKTGSIGPSKTGSIGPSKTGSIGPDLETAGSLNDSMRQIGLRELVLGLADDKLSNFLKGRPLTVGRHIDSIIDCEGLCSELVFLCSAPDLDLGLVLNVCEDLCCELESLIGVIPADDLLDSIFSNFCIGK